MGKMLDDAIIFATIAHKGGKRKGSDTPYIVHSLEALAIVSTMTLDEEVLAATVLHDVVEDTKYTIEDIKEKFGKKVASYVADESENKREDLPASETWKIRKVESIEHLENASRQTKMITLGDKLSNIRSMTRDYEKLGEKLWERFNQKDKKEHAWYYKNIAEISIKELYDFPVCKEYEDLVNNIFS